MPTYQEMLDWGAIAIFPFSEGSGAPAELISEEAMTVAGGFGGTPGAVDWGNDATYGPYMNFDGLYNMLTASNYSVAGYPFLLVAKVQMGTNAAAANVVMLGTAAADYIRLQMRSGFPARIYSAHFFSSTGNFAGSYDTESIIGANNTLVAYRGDAFNDLGIWLNDTEVVADQTANNTGTDTINLPVKIGGDNLGNGRFVGRIYWAAVFYNWAGGAGFTPDIARLFDEDVPTTKGSGTQITVTDTASGTDSVGSLTVTFTVTDSGSGVDATPGMAAAVTTSDTGSGSDDINVVATITITDTSTGEDISTITAVIQVADTSAGSDDISVIATALRIVTDVATAVDAVTAVNVSVPINDVGAGIDAITINASIQIPETASGNDNILVTVNLTVSDTGAGIDDILALILRTINDTATGSDAVSQVQVSTTVLETGISLDEIGITAALGLSDTGIGTDEINAIQTVLISIIDTVLGSDNIGITVNIPINDTGLGTESLVIQALLAIADSAQGIDVVISPDSPQGVAAITFRQPATESQITFNVISTTQIKSTNQH